LNDDNLELGERFFTALMAGDTATIAALYTPDATIWHNFDKRDQDRDANLKTLGWVTRHVKNLRYEEIRRSPLPDGFVQQHVLRGTAPDGSELDVPAILRFYCRDGQVSRIEEYLDTGQTKALR
jgi:ketosteroid isomerase-like protein